MKKEASARDIMLEHGKAKEKHNAEPFFLYISPHTPSHILHVWTCMVIWEKWKERKRKENKNAGRKHRFKGGMGRFSFEVSQSSST